MTASGDLAAGHVWLVGAGPGDPGLITVAGLAALRRAEVVLYDRLAPASLLDRCPAEAVLINAGKAADNHTMTQDEINASLVEHAAAGKRVVRLKGGDPFVFGRGSEEGAALQQAGLTFTVVPGVTSAIGGLGVAGIPVTHRGVASSFAVITGHEDPTKPDQAVHWDRLATAVDTLVVLMGVGRLEGIASALIAGGRAPETPSALVHAAATPEQRVVEAPLAEIAETALREGIKPPSLFVVGDVVSVREQLADGASTLAGRRVLVTRSRSQASTLLELLRAEGATPVELPAIEIERRADPVAVRSAIEALGSGKYGWTIFTSTNAVEVFFDLLSDEGADARAFAGSLICAIGAATARALKQRGLIADLVPTDASSEGVVGGIRRAIAGQSVLLPRAEGGREALPDGLRAAGATVDELTLYLSAAPAEPPADALELVRAGKIDAVTFASSSTVKNLAKLLGDDFSALREATIACIGPSTAETAETMGLPPDVVAAEHTVPGLVAALRAHLHSTAADSSTEAVRAEATR
jgi:uroporphyrinogen III methyltransferase/synthase